MQYIWYGITLPFGYHPPSPAKAGGTHPTGMLSCFIKESVELLRTNK